jgi:hypothetical protein
MSNQIKKYYTPKLEDLFVGYECEHTTMTASFDAKDKANVLMSNDDDVHFGKLGDWQLAEYLNYIIDEGYDVSKFIRTKYLDKEDFLADGWLEKKDGSPFFIAFSKDGIECNWLIAYKMVDMWTSIGEDKPIIRFCGHCPSVNEFRKLCQYLKTK